MRISRHMSSTLLAITLAACSNNGSSSAQEHTTTAAAADAGAASSQDAHTKSEPQQHDAGAVETKGGIKGQVKVLSGTPKGKVLIAHPGSAAIVKSADIAADGSFHVAGLEPDTYRLVLPADGVHATADMYVTVPEETGETEVVVYRSKGCPVTVTVRDHSNATVAGAELKLALTDLPQVAEPFVSKTTTDAKGVSVIVGSCVRGYYKGTLTVEGRGTYPIDHGYVGTGRDQFDIVLPEQPDAGVTYTNDD